MAALITAPIWLNWAVYVYASGMSSAALPEKTIEKLVVESAKRLGYEELKPLQKQAIY